MAILPDNKKFLPIEITSENSAAVGFIETDFYETHSYSTDSISSEIKKILEGWYWKNL